MRIKFKRLSEVVQWYQERGFIPDIFVLNEDIQCGCIPYCIATRRSERVSISGRKRNGVYKPSALLRRILTPCDYRRVSDGVVTISHLTQAHFSVKQEGKRLVGFSVPYMPITDPEAKRHSSEVHRANRILHRNEVLEDSAIYREAHHEDRILYGEYYRETHQEQIKSYFNSHRDERIKYLDQYRKDNADELREKRKAKNARLWQNVNTGEVLKWSTLCKRGLKQEILDQGWKPIE